MSRRDDAGALLEAFAGYAPAPADGRTPRIGTVQAVPAPGRVTLLFDGETVVGGKVYPCLASYAAAVNDRVVVLPVGSRTSWVVLGALA
jgi:hypothetical protein